MKPTLNEKLIAYLTLFSGLIVSAVAVYYSVAGLTAIFAAAVIPIIIMGVALEVGKLVATIWLKQNWEMAPFFVKTYLIVAIAVLMAITSMGIFGLLSKAHMDQGVPTGEIAAKVAIIDEKIKTEKDNIDANKQAIKQLDAQVDQVLARSDTENGAARSAALRRSQQKERASILADIQSAQIRAGKLAEEKAPISSQLRQVEAEVGPIKYIAAFFYNETNPTILEKAVTWVIILLIVVFDPLAVILLLASQYSFQSFREREEDQYAEPKVIFPTPPDKEPATETEEDIMEDPGVKEFFKNGKEVARRLDAGESLEGMLDVYIVEEPPKVDPAFEELHNTAIEYLPKISRPSSSGYVQNEEQTESGVWTKTITQSEYIELSEKHKREILIANWVDRVKTGHANINDVPADIFLEVKAKV